jgi:hypothetical protein
MRVLLRVVLLPLAVLACVTEAPQGGSSSPPDDPYDLATLDPAYAPDRELIAYGEARPECRMWTNWQKLCSRTGPEGSIHCSIDPGRSVSPSDPFCVAATGADAARAYRENFMTARETSLRFCEARLNADQEQEAMITGEPDLCASFVRDRPFNGRRIAAMRHPWCHAWSDAINGRQICTEGSDSGAPACNELAARGYEHENLLICSEWTARAGCNRPMGGAASPRAASEGIIVGGLPFAEGRAAWGTLCLDREN